MIPQKIIQALGIPMDDPPPWDGEVREVRGTIFGFHVHVLKVDGDRVTVQIIEEGVILRTRSMHLKKILLLY